MQILHDLISRFKSGFRLTHVNLQIITCDDSCKPEFVSTRIAFKTAGKIYQPENIIKFIFVEKSNKQLKSYLPKKIRKFYTVHGKLYVNFHQG